MSENITYISKEFDHNDVIITIREQKGFTVNNIIITYLEFNIIHQKMDDVLLRSLMLNKLIIQIL